MGEVRSFILEDLFTLAYLSHWVNITVALQTPHAAKAHISKVAALVVPPTGESAATGSYTNDLIREWLL